MFSLEGRKILVVGIANEHSIAWGCAQAFRAQGAELAVTYLNEKAEPHVRPLAESLDASIVLPLDVSKPGELEAVFGTIAERWGKLDVLLHSIAFAPRADLHGRAIDATAEGFGLAMDISVHSLLRMIRLAEPLMKDGGTCLSVSFCGSSRVVHHYNVMGPVKAALESAVRYAAAELDEKAITVHALSPGPLKTCAASGIDHFDELLNQAAERAPNPHDRNALKVVGWGPGFWGTRKSHHVGYVEAAEAARTAELFPGVPLAEFYSVYVGGGGFIDIRFFLSAPAECRPVSSGRVRSLLEHTRDELLVLSYSARADNKLGLLEADILNRYAVERARDFNVSLSDEDVSDLKRWCREQAPTSEEVEAAIHRLADEPGFSAAELWDLVELVLGIDGKISRKEKVVADELAGYMREAISGTVAT